MEIKYVHTFTEVDVDEFEELLANREFNQLMEKLPNVSRRTVIEEKDLGGGKRHTVVQYEAAAVPEQARKYLGDGVIGWVEEMDFNCNTHVHSFRLIPSHMKDRVKCEGQYALEPLGGSGGMRRIVKMILKVKMLGLGTIAERAAKPFIEANAREEERLTRQYILENIAGKKSGKSGKKSGK